MVQSREQRRQNVSTGQKKIFQKGGMSELRTGRKRQK